MSDAFPKGVQTKRVRCKACAGEGTTLTSSMHRRPCARCAGSKKVDVLVLFRPGQKWQTNGKVNSVYKVEFLVDGVARLSLRKPIRVTHKYYHERYVPAGWTRYYGKLRP